MTDSVSDALRADPATMVDSALVGTKRVRRPSGFVSGHRVGRYVVLEGIGSGGMGTVYAAYDPELDRRVALKILHIGAGGETEGSGGHGRLLREAQAIAKLAHPNVVAVFDVGTTPDPGGGAARVFMAMEWVRGQTLRQWLSAQPRSWRQIVDVFARAGRGLQAAHAAGVVHRDFKPDNVLVGDDGRVRVLDFGLAVWDEHGADVATDDGAPALTDLRLTRTGAVMGTPAYMAPEQHDGEPADARTDQYSFCVALCAALYGVRPFAGQDIATLAEQKRTETLTVPEIHAVPGWLRTALLRGLRADRDRRFEDMPTLLAQLMRDPARRLRRVGAGAGAAVALVSLGVLGHAMTAPDPAVCGGAARHLAGIWDGEQAQAMRTAFDATGVSFASTTWPRVEQTVDGYTARWVAARTEACEATHVHHEQSEGLLDRRMQCLDQRLAELSALLAVLAEPDAAAVQRAPAAVHRLTPPSVCEYQGAAVDEPTESPDSPERVAAGAAIRQRLAEVAALGAAGKMDAALDTAHAALSQAEALDDEAHLIDARRALGRVLAAAGEYDVAALQLRQAAFAAHGRGDDAVAAESATQLVLIVGARQARPEVARVWEDLAQASVRRAGTNPRLQVGLAHAAGVVALTAGDATAAIEHWEHALTLVDDDAARTASLLNNLGNAAQVNGNHRVAADHYRRALTVKRGVFGPDHPALASTLSNLAAVSDLLGDPQAAAQHFGRALEIEREAFGQIHPGVAMSLYNLGLLARRLGDLDVAEERLRQALDIRKAVMGPRHPLTAAALEGLAATQGQRGDRQAAMAGYDQAIALRTQVQGEQHPETLRARVAAAELVGVGDPQAAVTRLEAIAAVVAGLDDAPPPLVMNTRRALAAALAELGRSAEAWAVLEPALELGEQSVQERARVERLGATLRWTLGDRAAARALARAAQVRLAAAGPGHRAAADAAATWLRDHPPR